MIVTTKTPQQLIEEATNYLKSIDVRDIDNMTVKEFREFKALTKELDAKVETLGKLLKKSDD
ncbi:hypothetical protein ACW5UC_25345 [Priestia aryabhattai]|uniref:hypothetical protein n=1 Tax=Priestia megaterium TaxID=1404 RepID=UPI003F9A7673